MRKRFWSGVLLTLCLALGCVAPAMADSRKVVTLGADLTTEQQNTMMRYFGVTSNAVDTIYITNQDERNHLGSYVPIEQIGNYTFSCALVSPTSSGGIQVKTANLSWVTCNMIASTLSTSGVTNCQVVAASPFEVSGTGALTGVIMAYEQASKKTLDPVKVELANQELVTTGNLANEVGQSKATAIINETKIQVVENNITDIGEINNIVNNVSNEYNVTVNDDQKYLIAELMQQIAQQEYDITQLKATLERVQANVAGDAGASEEQQAAAEQAAQEAEQAAAEAAGEEQGGGIGGFISGLFGGDEKEAETESILDNTDVAALEEAAGGMMVSEGDTTTTVQEQSEAQQTENFGIPEATNDGTISVETPADENAFVGGADDSGVTVTTEGAEPADPGTTVETNAPADGEVTAQTEGTDDGVTAQTEEELKAEDLLPEDRTVYDEVKTALETKIRTTVAAEDGSYQVSLSENAAKKLPELMEQYLLRVFLEGVDAVSADEAADPEVPQNIMYETLSYAAAKDYDSLELQQVDEYVRRLVFKDSEKILEDSWLDDTDKIFLYDEIMKVFEKAFKEEPQTEAVAEETAGMEDFADDMDAEEFPEDEESMDAAADEFADFNEEEGVF